MLVYYAFTRWSYHRYESCPRVSRHWFASRTVVLGPLPGDCRFNVVLPDVAVVVVLVQTRAVYRDSVN